MPAGERGVGELAVAFLVREERGGSGCCGYCLYTQLLWDYHWDHVLLDYWIDQSNQCHHACCCTSVVTQYPEWGCMIWHNIIHNALWDCCSFPELNH